MISTPVFMRTMIDHPAFAGTDTSSVRLFSLGGAGVAPAMVREGAARVRLLVQAHVRLDRVPDAHDRPARRRPRARRDHRRPPDRRGRAAHRRPRDARRRRARHTGRAAGARARRCSSATSTPRSTPTRSSTGGWFRTGDLARVRRRVPHDRRPPEGHHHPRRREHLRAGGRGAARHAPGRRRGRVRRRARSGDGRRRCARS